jgi:hypothetical protein
MEKTVHDHSGNYSLERQRVRASIPTTADGHGTRWQSLATGCSEVFNNEVKA